MNLRKIFYYTFALCLITSCKSTDQKLTEMKPPIVVVSTGKFGDCYIKVVDSEGTFLTINNFSICSLVKGDTLIK